MQHPIGPVFTQLGMSMVEFHTLICPPGKPKVSGDILLGLWKKSGT